MPKTIAEFHVAIAQVAEAYGAFLHTVSGEDNLTTIEFSAGRANYTTVDAVCQSLADATLVNVYFNSATKDSILVFFGKVLKGGAASGSTIPQDSDPEISEYGKLFSPNCPVEASTPVAEALPLRHFHFSCVHNYGTASLTTSDENFPGREKIVEQVRDMLAAKGLEAGSCVVTSMYEFKSEKDLLDFRGRSKFSMV